MPTNTIPSVPNALPNQYIVSLQPNANLTQNLVSVQATLASDALCNDPGAPMSYIDTQDAIQDDQYGSMYSGNFTDRDVAFIQNTPEFLSIMRDSTVPGNITSASAS